MRLIRYTIPVLAAVLSAPAAFAQTATPPADPAPAAATPAQPAPQSDAKTQAGSPSLVIYFQSGSSTLRAEDKAILDRASRAYNEGKPIVMILTGTSDRVGNAEKNLTLSQRRATAVLTGLLDRGIPADRFQVLAKGQTELPIPTGQGVPEVQNRRVEITWR